MKPRLPKIVISHGRYVAMRTFWPWTDREAYLYRLALVWCYEQNKRLTK